MWLQREQEVSLWECSSLLDCVSSPKAKLQYFSGSQAGPEVQHPSDKFKQLMQIKILEIKGYNDNYSYELQVNRGNGQHADGI